MLIDDFIKTLQQCKPTEFRKTYGNWSNKPSMWSEDNIFCEKGSQAQFDRYYYSYVLYENSMLSLGRFAFGIALSFDFTGCLMASFKYKGRDYISHIPTSAGGDCRLQFEHFIQRNGISHNNFNIFKPYFEKPLCSSYWGLITKTGDCYSIGIDSINDKIVKIEKASSMPTDEKIYLCLNGIDLNLYRW